MNIENLKELIKKSSNKLEIISDIDILSKYNASIANVTELVKEFLDDEQKVKFLNSKCFENLSSNAKASIISDIKDQNIKLKLIKNSNIILSLNKYDIIEVITSLNDDSKIKLLQEPELLKKYDMDSYNISQVIEKLDEKSKEEILSNKELMIHRIGVSEYILSNLLGGIQSNEFKQKMIDIYDFEEPRLVEVIRTFSDKEKEKIVIENKYGFSNYSMESILSSLNVDSLIDFLNANKEYIDNNVKVYNITKEFDKQKQIDFVSKIDKTNLNIGQKRQVLATLDRDTKKEVDTSKFPEQYLSALKIESEIDENKFYGNIKIDFNQDMGIYSDLDELISINPAEVSEKNREKLLKLCDVCPKLKINDYLGFTSCTVDEYKKAEEWVCSVINNLNSKWTDIQKIAYIDNAIGKRISYSPNFDTEVEDIDSSKSLWKVINSGYGVCNGISQVGKYLLNRANIKSEMVSSKNHSFLKLFDIEVTNLNGEKVKGNTILDSTWDLAAQRFGAKPQNFCISYTNIRKHDITDDGIDFECHKNDKNLSDATLNLDDENLRNVFKSIGITRTDGKFPISQFIDKSNSVSSQNISIDEQISKQLALLGQYLPEFSKCQNSTLAVISEVLLKHKNLKFNKCVASRVYDKNDKDKRPVMYVYADLGRQHEKFYFADEKSKDFNELSPEEFKSRFECYKMDLLKQDGNRPWKNISKVKAIDGSEDLTRSSGKVAHEGGKEI